MVARKHKPKRRNLDAFTDKRGVVHPIRGSKGYFGPRVHEVPALMPVWENRPGPRPWVVKNKKGEYVRGAKDHRGYTYPRTFESLAKADAFATKMMKKLKTKRRRSR